MSIVDKSYAQDVKDSFRVGLHCTGVGRKWLAWHSHRGGREYNGAPTTMYTLISGPLRDAFKNYLADFFPLRGGGIPPHSAKFFWAH